MTKAEKKMLSSICSLTKDELNKYLWLMVVASLKDLLGNNTLVHSYNIVDNAISLDPTNSIAKQLHAHAQLSLSHHARTTALIKDFSYRSNSQAYGFSPYSDGVKKKIKKSLQNIVNGFVFRKFNPTKPYDNNMDRFINDVLIDKDSISYRTQKQTYCNYEALSYSLRSNNVNMENGIFSLTEKGKEVQKRMKDELFQLMIEYRDGKYSFGSIHFEKNEISEIKFTIEKEYYENDAYHIYLDTEGRKPKWIMDCEGDEDAEQALIHFKKEIYAKLKAVIPLSLRSELLATALTGNNFIREILQEDK